MLITEILCDITREIHSFSFVLNEVFVAARKHNTKRNKTSFILHACDSPPLNNRVKNKSSEFMFYYVNQKHETIYTRKYCTVLVLRNQHNNFARLINKPPTPLLLICRQNLYVDFVKPIV